MTGWKQVSNISIPLYPNEVSSIKVIYIYHGWREIAKLKRLVDHAGNNRSEDFHSSQVGIGSREHDLGGEPEVILSIPFRSCA